MPSQRLIQSLPVSFTALRTWIRGDDRRRLFESVGAGVWVLDPQDRTEYVNARMARLLGGSPEEMQDSLFLEFIPEEAHAAARAYLEQCRHGGSGQVDLPLRPRQGSPCWVIVSTHPLPAASDDPASLVCVVVDITERKQTEEARRKTEAHYRVLAETAEDQIFVINREDRVEYVNRAGAQQFRTIPEQMIGRLRSEIFPPAVAEQQGQSLRHVFDTKKPLYVERRNTYGDREVWLSTWLAPVSDEAGEVRAVLGFSRDMTERKRGEDALRASEQRLRVVLSNVPLVLWATDRHGVATFCAGRALEPLGGTPEDIVGRTFDAIFSTREN